MTRPCFKVRVIFTPKQPLTPCPRSHRERGFCFLLWFCQATPAKTAKERRAPFPARWGRGLGDGAVSQSYLERLNSGQLTFFSLSKYPL